jgi:hypothetical protein
MLNQLWACWDINTPHPLVNHFAELVMTDDDTLRQQIMARERYISLFAARREFHQLEVLQVSRLCHRVLQNVLCDPLQLRRYDARKVRTWYTPTVYNLIRICDFLCDSLCLSHTHFDFRV